MAERVRKQVSVPEDQAGDMNNMFRTFGLRYTRQYRSDSEGNPRTPNNANEQFVTGDLSKRTPKPQE
ncbi:MAG TPA: hypothetical protein VF189_02030 [Patescibacteria group bacterium]